MNQRNYKQPISDIKEGRIKVSDLASWYWLMKNSMTSTRNAAKRKGL